MSSNSHISCPAPPTSPARDSVRRGSFPAHLLAMALLLVLLDGCSVLNGATAQDATPTATPPPYQASLPTSVVQAGVCIDPSASVVTSFSEVEKQRLQQAVKSWVTQDNVDPQVATPSQASLRLTVRQVLTNSFSSSAPFVMVDVPAIAGLTPEPVATSPTFVDDDPAWQKAKQQHEDAKAAALAAAKEGAANIGAFSLDHQQDSEITGCLSALAETVSGPDRRLVIASDLDQNHQPEVAGDLTGASVLIVQPCGGDANACSTRAETWKAALKKQGAATITLIRPEQSSSSVYATFFQKGALS